MAKVNHDDRKHALLSASGASKWLNCTPSARLEEQFKTVSSDYADEGTLAHELADTNLRYFNKEINSFELHAAHNAIRKNKHYSPEMPVQVDKYTNYVIEEYNKVVATAKISQLLVEQISDYSAYVPDGFGTCDITIIGDNSMEIIDLKYGKGVEVSAVDNDQLKLYALGMYHAMELIYDINSIKMTIVQPRLDSISSFIISTVDLLGWANKVVTPAAEMAFDGLGEQKVGSWCRWCKAKPTCKAFYDHNHGLAVEEFKVADPRLISDADLLRIYDQLDELKEWIKAVHDHVNDKAKAGHKWPGKKLVHGQSKRRWVDEEIVLDVLLANNFDYEDVTNTKIKGITEIGNLMSVDDFKQNLTPYIIKPPGAPTLVNEDDKRPAIGIEQAKLDFGINS